MLTQSLNAPTPSSSIRRRVYFLLCKRVCETVGEIINKMEKKCMLPSWALSSSPAEFFTDKAEEDSSSYCGGEQSTSSVIGSRVNIKSTCLLRRITSAGSLMRQGRRGGSGSTITNESCFQELERECHSELEESSSFVAARSESVFTTAPVLCPPVPAEQGGSVQANPENKAVDESLVCSCVPAHIFAEQSGRRQEFTSAEFSSSHTNEDEIRQQMEIETLHQRATTACELDGPSDTRVDGLADCDAEHLYELCKLPSLDKLFDHSTPSQSSFSDDVLFATHPSMDEHSTDPTDFHHQLSVNSPPNLVTRSTRQKKSLMISGEIEFCPEEGIVTRDPHYSVQVPVRGPRDHKQTRQDFKNASNDGKTLTQRVLLWAGRVLKKQHLKKAFPRHDESFKQSVHCHQMFHTCFGGPHTSNTSTQVSPASVCAA